MDVSSGEIILGGGIAGLVWGFYHPGSVIITDKVGGQFSAPFQLGPKYLHKTTETEQLMKDLGENWKSRKIQVGFFYKGEVHIENTEDNRLWYFKKTRGRSSEVYKSAMSGGSTEFEAFDVGVEELVSILEKKLKDRIVLDKILQIDLKEKLVMGSQNHKYEIMISTIPQPVFLKLSGSPATASTYESYPTTFVQLSKPPYPLKEEMFYTTLGNKIDYVYLSQPEFRYHRITKVKDYFVIECRGDDVPEFRNELNRFVLKVGQLIEKESKPMIIEVMEPRDVKFFGRYAQWKHSIKTQELLKEIMRK